MNDDFYIGWKDRAPAGIRWRMWWAVGLLLGLVVVLGLGLAAPQRTIGVSVFEWGQVKDFTGILRSQPYPHLLVPRPGAGGGLPAFSSYYLVKPFKFGLDRARAGELEGKTVGLRGTLIYRGGRTLIEVVEDTLHELAPSSSPRAGDALQPIGLGRQTLRGEIVDSKCYLGVMNPGAFIPHRACAIRCISGGIPPVFLVRQTHAPPLCFLLVSSDGRPVNQQVLDLVAEPVEITGEVERQAEWLVLRADPAGYRRLPR